MKLDVWHVDGHGFHFGRQGLGLESTQSWFASDSLLAALLARLAELGGASLIDAVADSLAQDPPAFGLTSALPRAGSLCLFPNPLGGSSVGVDAAQVKALKRLSLLSETAFRRRLGGTSVADLLNSADGLRLQGGQVWVDPADVPGLPSGLRADDPLWAIEKRPRVRVDRVTARSLIYHAGRVSYAEGCGLWFGLVWRDERHRAAIEAALVELGHNGLGGERSAGFGVATVSAQGAISLPDPAPGGQWVNLGRYWPRVDEAPAIMGDTVAYTLQSVGGWVGSASYRGQRRKTVRLIAEGARLASLPRNLPGRLDDVRPTYPGLTNANLHPIWRGGPIVAVGVSEESS